MNEDCGAMSEKVWQVMEKEPCGDPQGTEAGLDGGDDEYGTRVATVSQYTEQ